MRKTERPAGRQFQLILIKPSHYDDQGYVVQWLRSTMPSNSLAAVFSLANGAAERKILGEDFPIDVVAIDETNTRVKPRDITRRSPKTAVSDLVGIIGVQSNEFPRAHRPRPDLARRRSPSGHRRLPCFGLPGDVERGARADIKKAQDLGISIFAGEAEEHLDEIVHDASRGELKPLYNHMSTLPDIGDVPSPPFLPARLRRADHRHRDQLRCRARLPVPMLVLHHHQRARTQVALSLRPTASSRSCG